MRTNPTVSWCEGGHGYPHDECTNVAEFLRGVRAPMTPEDEVENNSIMRASH